MTNDTKNLLLLAGAIGGGLLLYKAITPAAAAPPPRPPMFPPLGGAQQPQPVGPYMPPPNAPVPVSPLDSHVSAKPGDLITVQASSSAPELASPEALAAAVTQAIGAQTLTSRATFVPVSSAPQGQGAAFVTGSLQAFPGDVAPRTITRQLRDLTGRVDATIVSVQSR